MSQVKPKPQLHAVRECEWPKPTFVTDAEKRGLPLVNAGGKQPRLDVNAIQRQVSDDLQRLLGKK